MPLRTVRATRLLITLSLLAVIIGGGAWFGYNAVSPRIQRFFNPDIAVTIPEGLTAMEIDGVLADAGITPKGSVVAIAERDQLEGYLFPDTYRFRPNTDPEVAVARLVATFHEKADPVIGSDPEEAREHVIVASLLEREVTDPADRRIVAGIIERRLAERIPLQLDASICYAKKLAGSEGSCYPITRVDLTNPSPYNTYLYRGLTPGPIGNPGIGALSASIDAEASPYLFYLSDPATGRTIFSRTNEEHNRNREQYLK